MPQHHYNTAELPAVNRFPNGHFHQLPDNLHLAVSNVYEFVVLSYLIQCTDGRGYCFPSFNTLRQDLMSRRKSIDAIQGLERAGIIEITPSPFKANRYWLNFERLLDVIQASAHGALVHTVHQTSASRAPLGAPQLVHEVHPNHIFNQTQEPDSLEDFSLNEGYGGNEDGGVVSGEKSVRGEEEGERKPQERVAAPDKDTTAAKIFSALADEYPGFDIPHEWEACKKWYAKESIMMISPQKALRQWMSKARTEGNVEPSNGHRRHPKVTMRDIRAAKKACK